MFSDFDVVESCLSDIAITIPMVGSPYSKSSSIINFCTATAEVHNGFSPCIQKIMVQINSLSEYVIFPVCFSAAFMHKKGEKKTV